LLGISAALYFIFTRTTRVCPNALRDRLEAMSAFEPQGLLYLTALYTGGSLERTCTLRVIPQV
jgi:hypothetical protein